MDDPLEIVQILAEYAKLEKPPCGTVSQYVIHRLMKEPSSSTGPLMVFALSTALLTAFVALVAMNPFNVNTPDPLGAFFQVALIKLL